MELDLKQFSTNDLQALQSGDLTKLSTPGLKILQRAQRVEQLKKDNPGEYDPNSKEWQDKYGATSGMSGGQKFLAGVGKGMTDVARGGKQLLDDAAASLERAVGGDDPNSWSYKLNKALGMNSAKEIQADTQASVDEAKRTDAPLMKTGAGKAGAITGTVAATLPTVFIPGANTMVGAALTGGALGAAQPVATGESRLKNTVIGAAAGPLGVAAGRTIAAGAKGVKALVEPFTQKGRENIAARTLEQFGVAADDVANATNNATITGARQTMAEQIADPAAAAGAARLQDAVRSLDPKIAGQMAAREAENNAARLGTLKDLAGEGGARDFAEAMRNGTAKDLYGKAFSTKVDPSALSAAERGEVTKLLKLPAVKDAMKDARTIAANQGLNIAKPEGSIEGMHLMKLAMDDAIANAGSSAAAVNKAMSIKTARDRLVTFMERMSPEYGEARATYAAMSKPLNQADVAAEVLKRGTSATTDLTGNVRLMPDALARATKDEAKLITQATGGRTLPQKTLADLLEPDQLAKLNAVVGETNRGAAVARAANGPGSATADRLASQNVLRQVLGPTGLPQSWAESTVLNTAMRPVQFAYNGVAEPKIQAVLADLLMNPARANAVMQAAKSGGAGSLPKEVQAALPYLEQALKLSAPAAAVQR